MTPLSLSRVSLLAVLSLAAAAAAADEARDWLMKIERAPRELNYDGVFVYRHGERLETLRIVHKVGGSGVQERLTSLNGRPREIVRSAGMVQCYLPDENSMLIEHNKVDGGGFPSLLPMRLSGLNAGYNLRLGKTARIAARDARLVVVEPKDNYRYGYRLWADQGTGLLLKAELFDRAGKSIEQFMFTSLRTGIDIPDEALQAQMRPGATMHRDNAEVGELEKRSFEATKLPPGFHLTTRLVRKLSNRDEKIEHLLYSDGLASVSVFIEHMGIKPMKAMKHPTRMGAVHASMRTIDKHRVTVVGEVPLDTITLIAESIKPVVRAIE